MAEIVFTEGIVQAMASHALSAYPFECCGALCGNDSGTVRTVLAVLPIDNTSGEDRRRRFSIDPRDYLRAEREAARLGQTLLGFYHSHPDHPAEPSRTDREYAQPGFSYPILSVRTDGVADIRSWRLEPGSEWYSEEAVRNDAEARPGTSGLSPAQKQAGMPAPVARTEDATNREEKS
ncbi:MAG TPA: M67 family metallopeptidase [Candidatus Kapabacteria bacterium]|nr:M67 family metallopeptidase [Candidatus Kapabacteria bacterium]